MLTNIFYGYPSTIWEINPIKPRGFRQKYINNNRGLI